MLRVLPIDIEKEMKNSYISYAMSVIIARAIPDVRDGLKPVHRRILFSMHELGNTHDKAYRKSARTVGDVLGKYHPHGDVAIYDTLVRMAQPFSLRYMLVDGQGNFGSVDGDPPAAMRYTEARMSKISSELVKELSEDTVDFIPNFDNSLKEPVILPARFPQLLVNGSSGIAVAMVSSIPPHNLGEVVDALLALIDEKEEDVVLANIKGPDFPTGGIVIGGDSLREAYKTGRGKILVMAKAKIEDQKIIVTEIPYMVSKTRIIDDIVRVVKNDLIHGISDVHDRSDKRGISLEIVVKKGYNPENILHKLYEHTALRTTFSIISIALVDKKPKMLPLISMLKEFLKFREVTVKRRTAFKLRKAEARAHIIEGLLKALSKIDATISLLKAAKDVAAAKAELMELLTIDEGQAQAILDMKLQKIVSLEREKLEAEFKTLEEQIKDLKDILERRERLMSVIKDELIEIKEKYADERRTEIIGSYMHEDVKEETIVVYTEGGYIKRVHPSVIKTQNRGGVGVRLTSQDQRIKEILSTKTGEYIIVFTNKGKVHKVDVRQIPLAERYAKGSYIGNFVRLEDGEKPINIVKFTEQGYILMLTASGLVKRVDMKAFAHIRAGGIRAISFREGDSLVDIAYSIEGNEPVFVASKKGKCILFPQSQVRETGRGSIGVRAIRLEKSDVASNISIIRKDIDGGILTVTSQGHGRFTLPKDYRLQHRGGSGIINIRLKDGEEVVFSKYVPFEAELLLTSIKGMIIKISVSKIPQYSRNSRGVRLMKVKNDALASVAVVV